MTMKVRPKTAGARARERSEWLARQERRRRLTIGIWVAVGVAFVAVLAYLVWKQVQPKPRPGQAVPVMASDHVQIGAPHVPYNSDPPTSGPHYDQPAQWGFYSEAPPDEQLVHNLEHGYIIIWYNCSQLTAEACEALKADIEDLMGRAGVSSFTFTPKLIAAPRPTMETTLALTSWGRLDRLDAFDEQHILDFINAWRDKAPEPGAN